MAAAHRQHVRRLNGNKLAEEKLAALKEISLIYSQQLVFLGLFDRLLEDEKSVTELDIDRRTNDIVTAYNNFAQHYGDQAAVLLRNTMFVSSELGRLMIEHQKRVGQIVQLLEDFETYANDPESAPVQPLGESLAALQHAIAKELLVPPWN